MFTVHHLFIAHDGYLVYREHGDLCVAVSDERCAYMHECDFQQIHVRSLYTLEFQALVQ